MRPDPGVRKDRFARGYQPAGMNQVESRPLRHFVAVAQELSFARAFVRVIADVAGAQRSTNGRHAHELENVDRAARPAVI
jgi:hypothetical protein